MANAQANAQCADIKFNSKDHTYACVRVHFSMPNTRLVHIIKTCGLVKIHLCNA